MSAKTSFSTIVTYGLLTLSAIGFGSWYSSQANSKIPLARETTYLTQPLLPDGQVNYALAILQQQKEDSTPENNAAITFLEAIWPCDLPPNQWNSICREMEFDIPAEAGLRMPYHDEYEESFRRWLATRFNDPERFAPPKKIGIRDLLRAAANTPWSQEEFPPLANWVKEQTPNLDKLAELSGKSTFYFPMVLLVDYPQTELTSIRVPANQRMRSSAEALSIRAMHRLGHHQPEAAWRDIATIFTLSRMQPAIPSLIELNVSCVVCEQAIAATHTLIASGECDAALLMRIERQVHDVAPFDQSALAVAEFERMIALDTVIRGVSRQHRSDVDLPSIDARAMTIRLNENYDRIVSVVKNPNRLRRRELLKKLERELVVQTAPRSIAGELIGYVHRSAEGRRTADGVALVLLPAVMQICLTESRTNTKVHLLRVAISLERHRQQSGDYPATLLAAVDAQLARDPFADSLLQYHRRHEGYLLYSVFENQIDDTLDRVAPDDASPFIDAPASPPNLDIRLATPAPTFKSQLEAELLRLAL